MLNAYSSTYINFMKHLLCYLGTSYSHCAGCVHLWFNRCWYQASNLFLGLRSEQNNNLISIAPTVTYRTMLLHPYKTKKTYLSLAVFLRRKTLPPVQPDAAFFFFFNE